MGLREKLQASPPESSPGLCVHLSFTGAWDRAASCLLNPASSTHETRSQTTRPGLPEGSVVLTGWVLSGEGLLQTPACTQCIFMTCLPLAGRWGSSKGTHRHELIFSRGQADHDQGNKEHDAFRKT